MTPNRYSRIAGTGSFLPPNRVSNDALVEQLARSGIETSNQWIVERTGIHARHFAAPGVACSDLAVEAARRALDAADCDVATIDLI
ncbi:MAG: 3-oxoacyl-ACP synthase, partial [Caldimonas sp.]